MKSRFPSGISGWRAQGPLTLSRAARPPAQTAAGGWHRADGAQAPECAIIHAFQMTKSLKTAFLYNILILNRLRFRWSDVGTVEYTSTAGQRPPRRPARPRRRRGHWH